jgi:membrane protease YdiL (CAAX protease family)
MTQESEQRSRLWHGKPALTVIVLLVLGLTAGFPQEGVIGAFLIAIIVPLVTRKQGSYRDMGFRSPESWSKLLGRTLAYGIVIQIAFVVLVEPLLSKLTGETVDISVFEGVRGNFRNFLLMLALGWGVGGFLEEMTFRGFVTGRVRWLLGSGVAATWTGVLAAAVPFGIAHMYQGITGMLATGLIGFILGVVYVRHGFNLWYSIFTHGFINTVGILAMYLDIDREMGRWLF